MREHTHVATLALAAVWLTGAVATAQEQPVEEQESPPALGSWQYIELVDDQFEATHVYIRSPGLWEQKGNLIADDPLLVVRCLREAPIQIHVDWRPAISGTHLKLGARLLYEAPDGRRREIPVGTDLDAPVLFLLDTPEFFAHIEDQTEIRMLAATDDGRFLSARFPVRGVAVRARARCDLTDEYLPEPGTGGGPDAEGWFSADVITRPVPIRRLFPRITPQARAVRYQGIATLSFVVNRKGKPVEVKVLKPLPHNLSSNAVSAIKHWQFAPAELNGKRVAARYSLSLRFAYD